MLTYLECGWLAWSWRTWTPNFKFTHPVCLSAELEYTFHGQNCNLNHSSEGATMLLSSPSYFFWSLSNIVLRRWCKEMATGIWGVSEWHLSSTAEVSSSMKVSNSSQNRSDVVDLSLLFNFLSYMTSGSSSSQSWEMRSSICFSASEEGTEESPVKFL